MEDASALAKQASSLDPAVGLQAVAALRHHVDDLERDQVRRARADGWSWREIALLLRVSKQAVHQKHAAFVEDD